MLSASRADDSMMTANARTMRRPLLATLDHGLAMHPILVEPDPHWLAPACGAPLPARTGGEAELGLHTYMKWGDAAQRTDSGSIDLAT
jgi:hypothetical protein